MADYATHFAFEISVDGPIDWYDELTALCESAYAFDVPEDHPFAHDGWCYGLPVIERRDGTLVVHDGDGSGDLDTVAKIVRWILNQPGTPDSITFEYGCTCSRQRPGEFGGGVIKVTAETEVSLHTSDAALEALLDEMIAKRLVERDRV